MAVVVPWLRFHLRHPEPIICPRDWVRPKWSPLGFRGSGFASSGGSSPPSTPVRSLPKPPPRCRLPMSASAATPKTLLGGDDGRLASRHPIAACVAHVAQRRIWAVIRLGSPPPDHPPIYTRARVRGWPGDVLCHGMVWQGVDQGGDRGVAGGMCPPASRAGAAGEAPFGPGPPFWPDFAILRKVKKSPFCPDWESY